MLHKGLYTGTCCVHSVTWICAVKAYVIVCLCQRTFALNFAKSFHLIESVIHTAITSYIFLSVVSFSGSVRLIYDWHPFEWNMDNQRNEHSVLSQVHWMKPHVNATFTCLIYFLRSFSGLSFNKLSAEVLKMLFQSLSRVTGNHFSCRTLIVRCWKILAKLVKLWCQKRD